MQRDIESQRAMLEYARADVQVTHAVRVVLRSHRFRLWFMWFMGMNVPKP